MRWKRAATAATLLLTVASSLGTVEASTTNSSRRWPWRNGQTRKLTQVDGHTYASVSARKAYDVAMSYETVYSIGPGDVVTVSNSGAAGNYVQIRNSDGSVITYEHLSAFRTSIGRVVYMGDRIAISGDSGKSTGPHLHLQRSKSTSFSSTALSLSPIDGITTPKEGAQYKSSNAAIGTTVQGQRNESVRATYSLLGGWSTIGVPQSLDDSSTPCWSLKQAPTRWMYECAGGVLQTFQRVDTNSIIAASNNFAYIIDGGFEKAVTAADPGGVEYLRRLGMPRGQRYDGTSFSTQAFEKGYLYRPAGSCWVTVVAEGQPNRSTWAC